MNAVLFILFIHEVVTPKLAHLSARRARAVKGLVSGGSSTTAQLKGVKPTTIDVGQSRERIPMATDQNG